MGLIDELEAREAQGHRPREPTGRRARRQVGGAAALLGALLCLIGVFGGKWWTVAFDTGTVKVGLSSIEVCGDDDCKGISKAEFAEWGVRRAGDDQAALDRIGAWLGRRALVEVALAGTALGALLVGVMALMSRTPAQTGEAALALIALALVAAYAAHRFTRGSPVDSMELDTHAYLALAGLVDLVVGGALVASAALRRRSAPSPAPAPT